MASVCGSQISLLGKENNTEIQRYTVKSTRVTIGTHPLNTVRVHAEQVERVHCKIAANKRNEVEIINLSTRWPVLVNGVVVAVKAKLNDMDLFEVPGRLFRWHYCHSAKSGMKRRGMKQPTSKHTLIRKHSADDLWMGVRKAKLDKMKNLAFFEAMGRRRTIHSLQSYGNLWQMDSLNWSFEDDEHSISPVCVETNVGTLLRKKQMNRTSVHTPGGANKENDTPNRKTPAKTPKTSQLLHTSSVMIMSYTPTLKKTKRQEYLCKTPISSTKQTPAQLEYTPLSFTNGSNTGESIYLMDLTTPPASKSVLQMSPLRKTPLRMLSAANTSTPSPKKNNRTPASTLLKSVLRNAQAHKDLSAQLPVPEYMEPDVNVVSSTETVEASDERTIGVKNTFDEQMQTNVALGTPDFDVKSVIKKPNCTEQVRSSRYSDITPHESFEENDTTNQQGDGSTFVDLTISSVSLFYYESTTSELEIVEEALLDDESDDSNLGSPYNEDELLQSDTEFSPAEEIPNQEAANSPHTGYESLRDTRKFIGSAFTSLHTSRPQLDLTAEIDESLILNDDDDCTEDESYVCINDSCEEESGFDGITRIPPSPPPLQSHLIKETVKAPSPSPDPQHYEEQNKEKDKEDAPLNDAESMGVEQYRASTNNESSVCINELSEINEEPSLAQPRHSEEQNKEDDKEDTQLVADAEQNDSKNDESAVCIDAPSESGIEHSLSAQPQHSGEQNKEQDKEDAPLKDVQTMADAEEYGTSKNDESSTCINEPSEIGVEPSSLARLQHSEVQNKEEDNEDAQSMADAEQNYSKNYESAECINEPSESNMEPSPSAKPQHSEEQNKEEDKEDAPLKDVQTMADAEEYGTSKNDESATSINEQSEIRVESSPLAQHSENQNKEEDQEDAPLKDVQSMADAEEYGTSKNNESSTCIDESSEIGVEPSSLARLQHSEVQNKEEDNEDAQSMADAEQNYSKNYESAECINEPSESNMEPSPSAKPQHSEEQNKEEDKEDAPLKDVQTMADAEEYGTSKNDESATSINEQSEIGVESSPLAQLQHSEQQNKKEHKEDAPLKDVETMADAEEYGTSKNDESSTFIDESSEIGVEPSSLARLQHSEVQNKEEGRDDSPLKDVQSMADAEQNYSKNYESAECVDKPSESNIKPSPSAKPQHSEEQNKEEDKEDALLKDVHTMAVAEEYETSKNNESSTCINEPSESSIEPSPSAKPQHSEEQNKEEDKEDAPLKDVQTMAVAEEYGTSKNDESATSINEPTEIGVEPSPSAKPQLSEEQNKEEDKEDAPLKDVQTMAVAEEYGTSKNDESSTCINEPSEIVGEPSPLAQPQHTEEQKKEEDKEDAPLKDAKLVADTEEYGLSKTDESSVCTNESSDNESTIDDTKPPASPTSDSHVSNLDSEEDREESVGPVSSTTKDVFKHPRTPVVKRRLYSRNQHELKTPPIDAESPKHHVVSNEYPTLLNELVPKEPSKTDTSISSQTTLRRQLPPRASRNKIKTLCEEVIAGQSPELKFCKPKPSENESLDDGKESTSTLTMIDERRKIVFNNVVAVKHFSSPDIIGDVIKNTSRRGTKRATKQPGRKNTSDDERKAPAAEPNDKTQVEPEASRERDQSAVQEPNSPNVTKDVRKKATTRGKQGVKKGNKTVGDDQCHAEVPQTINKLEIISQEEQSISPGKDVHCVIVTSTPQLTTPLQLKHAATVLSHHNAPLDVTPSTSIGEYTPVRRTRRGTGTAAVTPSQSNALLRSVLLDVTPGTSIVESTPVRRTRRGAAAATVTPSESNVTIDVSDAGHEIESKLRTRRGRAAVAKETQLELPKKTRGKATKAKKGDETSSTTLVDSMQEQNLTSADDTPKKRLGKFASSTVENSQLSNDHQEQNDRNNVAETADVENEQSTIVQEEGTERIEKRRRGKPAAAKTTPKQKAPLKKDAAPKKGRPKKAATTSTLDSDVGDSTEKDVADERLATGKGRKPGKRVAESSIAEAVNDSGPKKTRRGRPATAKPDSDPKDVDDGENVQDEASLKKGRRGRAAVSKETTEQDSEVESAPKRGRKARQPATSKGEIDSKDASKQDNGEENLPVAKGRKPRKKAADAPSNELTSAPEDPAAIESDTATENVKTPEVKTKAVQRRGRKNKDAEMKSLDAAEQLTAAVLETDNESRPVRSTRRRRV